ncbi:DUF4286 family protein [Flavobacterium sp.]|uniref:DUF4286 family protein n=1 Tax=Flavobacterium sp. TaxID=239 RepID=UPI0026043CBF|nr:DUF4286 family protein [Flavobacterium sp.]
MIIYNVTCNVDKSIHDQWLRWMKETHIPEVLATGKFISARLVKVLVEEPEGATTYAVLYTAQNRSDLESYYRHDAPRLRQDGLKLFGDKMLAFRTELQVVEDFYQNT